jgi:UDP-N-acetylmuramoyl-tripeptide--D-alanyl-D-alanine ligase
MSLLTAAEIEKGTRGSLTCGSRDVSFSGISIDTRTLQSGDLFFAIRGPNQDGHRFIPDALSKGAPGVVAAHGYRHPGPFPDGRVLIEVADTHAALKDLAMWFRRRWSGILVAVTGSMGKTTTKEFAAHVLESRYSVCRTPGNYNNMFGLPLALFGLRIGHDIGIFEMGMSAPGEIAEMCRIAAPAAGVLTNIAPVHLAFFGSLEEIARAKYEIVEALPADGTLVYNADDDLVRAMSARYEGAKVSFGFSDAADIRADQVEYIGLEETRFRLICGREALRAFIPFAGAHYLMNALAAVALGRRYDVAPKTMVESLASLPQPAMRGRILRFREGFTVIDDSYNSNPRALMQMIDVLARTPSFKRRILVAGEMLELGKDSDSLHYECGVFAAKRSLDLVVGIQGAARAIVQGALESGMSDSQVRFFADTNSASGFVGGLVRDGDLMLVKGSRGVRTERIVQGLCSRFELQSPGAGSHAL